MEEHYGHPHLGGGSRDPLDDMHTKKTSKTPKKPLTKQDSLEKMCADIRKIAEVTRQGHIWYPTMANPSIFCKVVNGLITRTHILFINANYDKEGVPILPEHSVEYQSD